MLLVLTGVTLASCMPGVPHSNNRAQSKKVRSEEITRHVPVEYSVSCSPGLLDVADVVVTYQGADGTEISDTLTREDFTVETSYYNTIIKTWHQEVIMDSLPAHASIKSCYLPKKLTAADMDKQYDLLAIQRVRLGSQLQFYDVTNGISTGRNLGNDVVLKWSGINGRDVPTLLNIATADPMVTRGEIEHVVSRPTVNKRVIDSNNGEQLTTVMKLTLTQDLADVSDLVVTYKGAGGIDLVDTITTTQWEKTIVNTKFPTEIGMPKYRFIVKPGFKPGKGKYDLALRYSIQYKEGENNTYELLDYWPLNRYVPGDSVVSALELHNKHFAVLPKDGTMSCDVQVVMKQEDESGTSFAFYHKTYGEDYQSDSLPVKE